MDPGLVRLTCIFQCFMLLFASWICVKIGGRVIHVYMIRMHAYRCDKSNDISTCSLKEFECIQEYKNNSDMFKKYKKIMGFKIQDSRM